MSRSVNVHHFLVIEGSILRLLLLLSALFTLSACDSSKMKEVAIEAATKEFGTQIRAEMDETGVAQHELAEQYFSFIIGHTEYEVLNIDKKDDATATVKLNMETIPKEFRTDLSNVVVKLQGISTTRFNMGEAILHIKSHYKAKFDTQVTQKYIQLHKKDGEWSASQKE